MIPAKLGRYPSRDVDMGTNFRYFRTFFAGADAVFCIAQSPFVRFVA